jgi:hypothetical protein
MSGREAFDPYSPLDVLKQVAAGVWIVDGPEIQFSYLGLKFPLPTRMTLIRLPDGGLWIHSPTSLTDALAGQVLQAGPVQFLIAPNTLHYWWIPDWKTRFPYALVYAAPGLEDRPSARFRSTMSWALLLLQFGQASSTKSWCAATCSLRSPSSTTRHAP